MTIAFIATSLAWVVSVTLAAVLSRYNIREEKHSILKIFLLFLIVYTFEYYILGNNSFIEMGSEGNISIPAYYSFTKFDLGQFSQTVGGGQDNYIWFLGKQYFQPEKHLLEIMPIWVTVLAHKFMVAALSFAGIYLLVSKISPHAKFSAAMLAIALSTSHIYLTTFSMTFGTGFAAIPLAVYLCIVRSREEKYWLGSLFAGVVLMAADPMKVFPALAAAGFCSLILLRDIDFRRVLLSFLGLLALSILNWHEVLYALIQSSQFVARGVGPYDGTAGPMDAVVKTLGALYRYSVPFSILLVSLVIIGYRRDFFLKPAIGAVMALLALIIFVDVMDWSYIGLEPINRLSHQQYMILALPTITAVIAAHVFSNESPENIFVFQKYVSVQLLCIVIAVFSIGYQKTHNALTLLAFGGQSAYQKIDVLNSPDWRDRQDYRSVTFYETPNANVVAGVYGIPSFDGQANLNNQYWSRYWVGVLKNKLGPLVTRIGWQWEYWNGTSYHADKHVRFDLLAIANVRYALSPLPLSSPNLRLIHEPPANASWRTRPNMFPSLWEYIVHRIELIFYGGDNYVYEIKDVLPRIYSAQNLNFVPDTLNDVSFLERVILASEQTEAVAREADAKHFGVVAPATMTVDHFEILSDGYNVNVKSPEGGILMVNMMYWPWWRASSDSGDLPIIPANGVQMAVNVPKGTKEIKLRYHRPTVADRAAELFSAGASD